jgi:hypothetical protein
MTDRRLQNEFELLNDRFFSGKITLTYVGFSAKSLPRGAMGAYFNDSKRILIDPAFKNYPRICTELLLHEMAHAHLDLQGYVGYPGDAGHGNLFAVEIDRLYKAGGYDGIL